MNWIILVLLATLVWSVGSIINKFARVRYFENSLGYVIFIAPMAFFALILLFFEPLVFLGAKESVIALFTGVLATTGYYLYLEALHKEEVSRVQILLGAGPLFILVLSVVFLKETLTARQYTAFVLIFAGSMIVSLRKVDEKIKFSLGIALSLLAAFFFSVQNILFKYISEVNLTTVMIYREFGYLVTVISIFLISSKARRYTKKVIRDMTLKQTTLVYAAEITGISGMFFLYLAIQHGPVSLVTVLEGFQPIFILLLTLFLSAYSPNILNILKEEITKEAITIKIISIILMLGGLYLIVV